jgi:hypothetical protein
VSRRRRALLAVAGVALVGVLALVLLARLAAVRSDVILAAVGRALGRDVRADGLGITLWGGPGVALRGVTVAEDPAFGGDAPFVTAGSAALRLRLLPLLLRRVVVDRVTVEAPVVNVVREPDGRLNVDTLGKHPPAASSPGSGDGQRRPAFQVAALRLRGGTIRYEERKSGRRFALSDVTVDARQPAWGAAMPVTLRARLAGEDVRLDGIAGDGVLDLGAGPTYQGTLRAGPGAIGGVAIDRLTADVRAKPPLVDLDRLTVETLGGTVTGEAHLHAEEGVSARIDGRGLELAKVPAAPGRPRPAGSLALQGAVSGPATGAFAAQATGQGGFTVTDGRIEGAGFGKPVLDALEPLLRPGLADRLRQRYPDLFTGDDLRFTRLSGSGRLGDGRIRSDNLVLVAKSWEARGEGSLGVGGDLDAHLRLLASPALTDDILGQSHVRATLVDASGRLAIPLRVTGTARRPHVSPDPAFAGTLAGAFLGKGAGEAAGQLLERLLGEGRKKDH